MKTNKKKKDRSGCERKERGFAVGEEEDDVVEGGLKKRETKM